MTMRVPEIRQQSRYQDPSQQRIRFQGMQVQTNAEMFGGGANASGLAQLGRGLQDASNTIARISDDYNSTKAREASTALQQEFLAWQSEAQKLKGEAGMNVVEDYGKWSQRRILELEKGMNDVQRGRFRSMAAEQTAAQAHWASGYGEQQRGVFDMATWGAELKVAGEDMLVNIQNPSLAGEAMKRIKDASFTIGQRKGLGEAGTKQLMRENIQQALGPAISGRIEAGQLGESIALVKQYENDLGPELTQKMRTGIEREKKRQEAEARARAAEGQRVVRETTINNAYRALYAMSPEEAQEAVANPEWQQSMGLTVEMAKDAGSLLHTMRNWQVDAQKQKRQKYESDLYTKTVNMALGSGGEQKNPVAAMQSIQIDDTIDGKTKMEMLNALQNNIINSHDDSFFVNDLRSRIIDNDGAISDSEILQGVATGKMRQSTAEDLMKLREIAQGGNSSQIKHAYTALNEMFKKSMMADGTPEQAGAHLAAQRQLQADIDAAMQRGDRKELDRITSPEYIMEIGKKNMLSIEEQQQAALRKISPESGTKRNPGESISEYQKRMGK